MAEKFVQKPNSCYCFKNKDPQYSDFSGSITITEPGEYYVNLTKKLTKNQDEMINVYLKKKGDYVMKEKPQTKEEWRNTKPLQFDEVPF